MTIESGGHTVPQGAYRFPRILGKTFPSDESSKRPGTMRGSRTTAPGKRMDAARWERRLILTSMPDLPPRPETPANASFRRNFYAAGAWWCSRGRRAMPVRLRAGAIGKDGFAGREHYFVDRRRITVTPRTTWS